MHAANLRMSYLLTEAVVTLNTQLYKICITTDSFHINHFFLFETLTVYLFDNSSVFARNLGVYPLSF